LQFDPEIKFYPNPFIDELSLSFNLEENAGVGCKIFDVTGRMVYQAISQNFSEGAHLMKIDTRNFSQGIYTLQLSIDDFEKNIKLTKLNDR